MQRLLHAAILMAEKGGKDKGKGGSPIEGLLRGISPDWGPFDALEKPAQQVIGVVMACVVLFLLGTALVGAANIKVGNSRGDMMDSKKGQHQVASALTGLFVVAAMVTIFTIVYGMGGSVK
ncbi:hypothetical protein [Streptomyces rhizosphaericus]|uniref:hypothetical protein n=1 Tax=Streptomyces rhizosphaericus TaxID=114699 RepID=UPI00117F5D29|nr:hypothetical protein [Streptomyces rhizosphaericus]